MSHNSHHRNRRRKNALTNLQRQFEATAQTTDKFIENGAKHKANKDSGRVATNAKFVVQLKAKMKRQSAEMDTLEIRIKGRV